LTPLFQSFAVDRARNSLAADDEVRNAKLSQPHPWATATLFSLRCLWMWPINDPSVLSLPASLAPAHQSSPSCLSPGQCCSTLVSSFLVLIRPIRLSVYVHPVLNTDFLFPPSPLYHLSWTVYAITTRVVRAGFLILISFTRPKSLLILHYCSTCLCLARIRCLVGTLILLYLRQPCPSRQLLFEAPLGRFPSGCSSTTTTAI